MVGLPPSHLTSGLVTPTVLASSHNRDTLLLRKNAVSKVACLGYKFRYAQRQMLTAALLNAAVPTGSVTRLTFVVAMADTVVT